LCTDVDDTDPAPSFVRDELLFASNRGSDFDLYAATPVDSGFDVARIDELCSKDDEREPSVASDGRTACFASKLAGTRGFDLFRAQRTPRGWTGVESMTALNGPLDERAPLLLSNGFEVWFARRAATGSLDLYRSHAVELVRVPPRGWSTAEILSIASLLALALLALLAERWPGLDTIYKCFLVSVLVHLFLLWWLHSVRIENGGAPSGKKRDRIRVHVREDGRWPPIPA
jgi:hypothetical protein